MDWINMDFGAPMARRRNKCGSVGIE